MPTASSAKSAPRRIRLCRFEALEDPGARGVELVLERGVLELFVLRRGDAVRAYRNSCPHTGANLNWLADRFFDAEGRWVQCALHGALFDPLSGECIHGPCLGRFLHRVPVSVEDGVVWLAAAAGDSACC